MLTVYKVPSGSCIWDYMKRWTLPPKDAQRAADVTHWLKWNLPPPWNHPLISIIPERKHPFSSTVLSK